MSAAAFPCEPPHAGHQRAVGDLAVVMKRRGATTVLADLRQEGCLKARFPRPAGWAEAVLLNSSGGIAGGDRLRSALGVAAGAAACFTGQAAERFYRALPDDQPAHLRTRITIGAGAAAEWLPQESILFDGAALDRALDVDLAADGWFLGVEMLLFGRAAMGERMRHARVRDTIRIRRAARLVWQDSIRLDGATPLSLPAIAAGAQGVATLVHVAPDAEARLDVLRAAWATAPAEAAASAWRGMVVGRVVAGDGACLRATIVAGLQALRAGRPLPRVWLC
ncbi:MAG: urease accessory protein UreD [Burkholderiales bacterium]|nr:urease accessory protein UreD [Burkholderiales bacterium]MDE2197590.1 urease accessory protein UreD [Rhodospirillales bacterium]MDE2576346.1 urease accessory protein UreD [Rhodospirillales bacterium]